LHRGWGGIAMRGEGFAEKRWNIAEGGHIDPRR
jgi:hypothetical protein